uniref:hypothetical protein n=1 Tax=Rhodoblastus sp. TaxID=1962975 RepID=UPI003F9E40C0
CEINLAWSRWYRRAITKSVAQLRGAERWITKFPDLIFLDPHCTQKFPIDLPPADRRRFHAIVVATGATEAVRTFCNDDSGTFLVSGWLKGDMHVNSEGEHYLPFSFGDVDPEGHFVHVFDPTALDVIMRELDTVTDFAEYLKKRAEFMRSGRFSFATGEEDLLGIYLQNMGEKETHDFLPASLPQELDDRRIQIVTGEYNAFIASPRYQLRKNANEPSYVWDWLIEHISDSVLAGTAVRILGEDPEPAMAERALRLMAIENRVYRRILGEAFRDTLLKAQEQKAQRFVRKLLPGLYDESRRTAYVILVFSFSKKIFGDDYATYRDTRARMLEVYCFDILDQINAVEQVVGIAVDAAQEVSGRSGGSEELMALDRSSLIGDYKAWLEEAREALEITPLSDTSQRWVTTTEYPSAEKGLLSRQQRRAAKRAQRKAERSRGDL